MRRERRRPLPAMLVVGAVLLLVMVVIAVVAPIVWGDSAQALTADIRQTGSSAHLLGTDSLGRDVLYRTLVATRLTLIMALCATAVAVGIGTLLGAGVVLAGRFVRGVGARVIDLLVSYPPIIVALTVTAIFSPGRVSVVFAIGLAFCPQFARLTNTLAASVSARDYVVVARLLGTGRARLLSRHVLPNIAAPVLVLTSVGFATSIVALSGLSFLGLGVQQPSFDWGMLLASGLRDLSVNPIESLGPSVGILLTGLGAGLLGDGLARYWEPRQHALPERGSRASARVPKAPPVAAAGGGDVVAELRDLTVSARGAELVRGVSLDIRAGEIVGLVGESGSGKSVTAMAMARLLPAALTWTSARHQVNGIDLSRADVPPPTRLATDIGVVFQDPASCFNPALHVGTQLTEVLRVHRGVPRRQAAELAVQRLREVRVSAPESRMHQYPHELSGGMRQRAMIAMALLSEPKLLIADEPTTALDVTVQADVLRLLHQINADHGTAMLLISHDINVVSALCQRVCVMYAGRIVEEVAVADLRAGRVHHPYTKALLAASPGEDADRATNPLRPLPGRPPRPGDVGDACSFAPRCPLAMPRCREEDPLPRPTPDGGVAACHAVDPALVEIR
ncbi:MAG TPA: dipeptide/oligopeptide/nickel ABC transporter permease/ATP-binding protein [Pseudonocardiaceae bacterium]|nr:dipeptide/oligopeptide/nickel ABC transporter permease/ATP-binding protein [Pseudonocardiaceae bacterium]